MIDADAQAVANAADAPRTAALAAALRRTHESLRLRVHESAEKRTSWQQELDALREEAGRPPQSAGQDAGSLALDVLPALQAGVDQLHAELVDEAAGRPLGQAVRIEPAVAAAARQLRGKTARGIVRDLDRLFILTRNQLLHQLDNSADDDGQPAEAADTTTDRVVDLATEALKEHQSGTAALTHLLDPFDTLLADLPAADEREHALHVLAHLVMILLIRLVRELVEELSLIAAPLPQLPSARPAAKPSPRELLRQRVCSGRMPNVLDGLRIVHAPRALGHGSRRPKSPIIATLRRGQVVMPVEKRGPSVRVWAIDPRGGFRMVWVKGSHLRPT